MTTMLKQCFINSSRDFTYSCVTAVHGSVHVCEGKEVNGSPATLSKQSQTWPNGAPGNPARQVR